MAFLFLFFRFPGQRHQPAGNHFKLRNQGLQHVVLCQSAFEFCKQTVALKLQLISHNYYGFLHRKSHFYDKFRIY